MPLSSVFRKLLLIQLLIGPAIIPGISAQTTGQFVESSQQINIPFTITNYNTKHGLPQNQVTDIVAKANDELILSTANGIVSYDGYMFTDFIENKNYKKDLFTHLLYSEKYKKLYGLRLGGGFSEINPKSKRINLFKSACLYNDQIYGILADGTISRYNPKDNAERVVLKTGITNPGSIHFDGKRFIVSGESGIYFIDATSKKITKTAVINNANIIEDTYTKTIYFLGTTKAYRLLKNDKIIQLIPEMKTDDFVFNDMAFTPEGEIYIGTTKGLIYIGDGHTELYDERTFLPSKNISSLCYSATERCIFAGTTNKGLLKLQLKNCSSLIQFADLSNASICSVLITSSGKTLACASDGYVYSISVENAEKYIHLPFQPSSMSEINGEIWVGTWSGGIYRYKNKKLLGQITEPQIKSTIAHSIFKDSRGTIWIGTSWGVSAGKTAAAIKPVLSKEIIGQIITIYEKKNGNILLGGSGGLYELDKNRKLIRHWSKKDGLICKEIRALYEDEDGKIWIGTYDGGLYCLEMTRQAGGKVTSINNMQNCMLNEDVFTLAKDYSGNIYMTSNNGLWVVNEKQLNDFYRHRISYLIPFVYASEAGIMNTEFNGGFQNNYAHSKYDYFYFPSIEGLVIVSPEKSAFRKIHPEVRYIEINNEAVPLGEHVFERNTHSIEFNFRVANYSSKFNVFYQYLLIGPNTSNEWEEMHKSGKVRLSFLPPGDYTIRIRALDAYNDPNPELVDYRFTIKPYYYETWWFRILIGLLLLTGITFIIWKSISAKRKKEIRENTINNNIIELKLKAIQAKMNPHFIFNTLNNIQYLIILDRKEAAENALSEFSQLLRKFLQQSDQSFVKLSDEITIIQKYLYIEQIRFDGKMEIVIDMDEPCGECVIPTLLLQPVVENAIKHGLAHSQADKKLIIRASCTPDLITISIEDNGIGREASKDINSFRDSHVSHGWKLVEDKIEMVQQKYGVTITCEIFDKSPETGTIVTFKIPKIDEQLLDS